MGSAGDTRIKNTLDKALSKVRHQSISGVVFIKVEDLAEIKSYTELTIQLLKNKKYRMLQTVYLIIKRKSYGRGFDLEYYWIHNEQNVAQPKLQFCEDSHDFGLVYSS